MILYLNAKTPITRGRRRDNIECRISNAELNDLTCSIYIICNS